MKISTKVNIILTIVFIGGILISGTALSTVLQQKAQNEVTSKAKILMQMANSVREYTNERVHPLLLPLVDTKEQFIAESIPTFATREVFEYLRKTPEYARFVYKDATLNPINLRDKADDFEANIVKKFRQEPSLEILDGYRNVSGEQLFYTARPFAIRQQSCLSCHTTPELAPKSQVLTYGRENGYGWKLNSVVATQIVYVPAENIFKAARQAAVIVMGALGIIFLTIVMVINLLLKKTVIQRIKRIATVAEKVSIGEIDANFDKQDKDEIGVLAEAINRMKYSLEIALKLLDNNTTTY